MIKSNCVVKGITYANVMGAVKLAVEGDVLGYIEFELINDGADKAKSYMLGQVLVLALGTEEELSK